MWSLWKPYCRLGTFTEHLPRGHQDTRNFSPSSLFCTQSTPPACTDYSHSPVTTLSPRGGSIFLQVTKPVLLPTTHPCPTLLPLQSRPPKIRTDMMLPMEWRVGWRKPIKALGDLRAALFQQNFLQWRTCSEGLYPECPRSAWNVAGVTEEWNLQISLIFILSDVSCPVWLTATMMDSLRTEEKQKNFSHRCQYRTGHRKWRIL